MAQTDSYYAVVFLTLIDKTRLVFRSTSSQEFVRIAAPRIQHYAKQGQWFIFYNDPQKRPFFWDEDKNGKFMGGLGEGKYYFERYNNPDEDQRKSNVSKLYDDVKNLFNGKFLDTGDSSN